MLKVNNFSEALSLAKEKVSHSISVTFVDHGNRETFNLVEGIWKGTYKEFTPECFAHVVAGFWLLHRGDRFCYTERRCDHV